MNNAKELLNELKKLIGKTDEKSEKRRAEIAEWFQENNTPENVELFQNFVADGLDNIRAEVANIRREIKDEDYRLLPLSYIANRYFKKSSAWLSQRINGTPVRGKVYTLSSEQKNIFNNAVKEIGQKIGSFRLA